MEFYLKLDHDFYDELNEELCIDLDFNLLGSGTEDTENILLSLDDEIYNLYLNL